MIHILLSISTHPQGRGKGKDPEGSSDVVLRHVRDFTYPDGDAILITPSRKLDDELGAGLLLGIVERSKPADHLDTILGGDLSLPRCLHCHRRERGGNETIHA